jgi:hypothetical protein
MYCGEKKIDMIMKYCISIIIIAIMVFSCTKEDYEIEYQDGYPNKLTDNWIAFEFQGGDIEGNILDPYDLITALDPNRERSLIIDKLYDSDTRVRAEYNDTAFFVDMGEQLELISTNTYGIKFITIDGYVTENPVLTNAAYDLALLFFENMAFQRSDIKDVIFIRAGFYDEYRSRIDTVLILGYRKTGFENIEY